MLLPLLTAFTSKKGLKSILRTRLDGRHTGYNALDPDAVGEISLEQKEALGPVVGAQVHRVIHLHRQDLSLNSTALAGEEFLVILTIYFCQVPKEEEEEKEDEIWSQNITTEGHSEME